MQTYIFIEMNMYILIYTYIHMSLYMSIRVYIYTCVQVYIHVCRYIHICLPGQYRRSDSEPDRAVDFTPTLTVSSSFDSS